MYNYHLSSYHSALYASPLFFLAKPGRESLSIDVPVICSIPSTSYVAPHDKRCTDDDEENNRDEETADTYLGQRKN